ncbi:MAG TPA: cytochrome C [Sulfurospirillum sp. UBA11407]|jgi:cytochrome c553|nr:MAG TPA: cytochrome C [Sulfurospirillum sp. UBA11407]DAB35468.1 MAG TPA: cytochrome C [Sulfurospirillum sp. UBA12182]
MKKMMILVATLFATALMANDGAALYKKCAVCHGAMGEKKALGKSEVIAGWDAQKIEQSLKGYQDGSYGGALKGTMKAQVKGLNEEQIKTLSAYIDSLM